VQVSDESCPRFEPAVINWIRGGGSQIGSCINLYWGRHPNTPSSVEDTTAKSST